MFAALALTAAAGLSYPKVHVHVASEKAFAANAYLVETAHGVVAVDAPFTVSEAKAFRAELEALKKPLLAVLVTHAHPDHVNGVTELLGGRPVPVYATAGVTAALKAIDAPKRAYWTPIYKEEYPAATTFPNHAVKAGATLSLDGVRFQALDLGAGESAEETVWVMDGREAFVGDLVMNRVHPWLAEGRSAAWLASLAKAEGLLKGVSAVHPGHGAQGGFESLAWQRSYLTSYRGAVTALAQGRPALDEAAKQELARRMEAVLPQAPLAMLVPMSADAVAAELAAK